MKLLIAGASGMVGSEVVRLVLKDKEITTLTTIVRKTVGFGSRVAEVIHRDFLNYDTLRDTFVSHDAFIWCLGISQSRVNAKEYFTITHDYAAAAANAVVTANPKMPFLFVSAMGADTSGRSPIRFCRVKGQAENTLKTSGIEHLYIFRPGAIVSNPEFGQPGLHKKVERFMMRSFSILLPQLSISVTDLARLMLFVAKTGGEKMTYSQKDIFKLTRRYST